MNLTLLVVLVLAVLRYVLTATDPATATALVSAVVAVLVAAGSVGKWLWVRGTHRQEISDSSLARVGDLSAEQVRVTDTPEVHNEVSGTVTGAVVQAGTVHGGRGHVHPLRPDPVTPRQLPAAPGSFTGRTEELTALTDALNARAEQGATMVISVIGGSGGIGKTWLALHWAHQHADRFPDGQLFVDLRGFSPSSEPMSPTAAIRGFLDALGVDPAGIPVDLDAQAGLYRSLVADRRMLILLDNARDTTQVMSLLPGASTCTVLVTSRRQLAGLVARHGARLLGLNVLMDAEARELFVRYVGLERAAAEPEAVAELLGWCAGLPLAIGIVAVRAAKYSKFPLAVLAEELRAESARLDALDGGELTVNLRAVFSWSYRALDREQAMVFGLLGLSPGPDISLSAVVNLTGLTVPRTRTVLGELEGASLVQQPVPGRYRMHDLIRLYAVECVLADLDLHDREAAQRRLIDYYIHTAHIGDRLLHPHRDLVQPDLPSRGCHPDPLVDEMAALAWFDAEHPCLLVVQHLALEQCWHRSVWQLAWTLDTFHWRRGYLHDDLTVWQAALAAARQLSEPIFQTKAHRRLGLAYARIGGHVPALDHLQQALTLAEKIGDTNELAHVHWCLAWAWDHQHKDQQALEHAARALHLFHVLDQPAWEAETLNEMGRYCVRLGLLQDARTHCEHALTLCRHHNYGEGEASALDALGYVAQHSEQHIPAMNYYQQALVLYRDLGYSYEEPNVLDRLGHVHAAFGSYDEARQTWRQALELYRTQYRTADADRMQQQLAALDEPPDAIQQ